MKKLLVLTAVSLIFVGLFAACGGVEPTPTAEANNALNVDSDTAVLPTIQIAELVPETNTPTPTPVISDGSQSTEAPIVVQPVTATPLPQPICTYAYSLIESISVPATVMNPGTGFLQTWRIRNDGNCAWGPGASWVFVSGDKMGGPDLVALPAASPGQTVDVMMTLYAPATQGTYTGLWQPQMADGTRVEPTSSVTISVIPPQPTATAVPPTPTATPFITGWRGEYFNNINLEGTPVFVRDDQEINFDWGTSSPGDGVQNGNFSVRWTRTIAAPGGTYRFFARSEDGVRVWVNGILLFDEWREGENATYQSDIILQPGELLDIRVEYFHDSGLASVHAWGELQSEYPNWRGSYIADPNLQGEPVLIRNDLDINFDWGLGAPAAGMPPDNFSVVWLQTINFSGATYQFNAVVDDGMQLFVDDTLVIDAWQDGTARQVSGVISLTPGEHDITVTYYDRLAEAEIQVWWEIKTGIE